MCSRPLLLQQTMAPGCVHRMPPRHQGQAHVHARALLAGAIPLQQEVLAGVDGQGTKASARVQEGRKHAQEQDEQASWQLAADAAKGVSGQAIRNTGLGFAVPSQDLPAPVSAGPNTGEDTRAARQMQASPPGNLRHC